MLGSKVTFEKN